jgi:hypothetical protein
LAAHLIYTQKGLEPGLDYFKIICFNLRQFKQVILNL